MMALSLRARPRTAAARAQHSAKDVLITLHLIYSFFIFFITLYYTYCILISLSLFVFVSPHIHCCELMACVCIERALL